MANKQPAFGNAILWGDGVIQGESLALSESPLFMTGVKLGSQQLLSATARTWYSVLVDPLSMTDAAASILGYGENGHVPGLRVGPEGAWFYPSH